jgi:hypothetical protein
LLGHRPLDVWTIEPAPSRPARPFLLQSPGLVGPGTSHHSPVSSRAAAASLLTGSFWGLLHVARGEAVHLTWQSTRSERSSHARVGSWRGYTDDGSMVQRLRHTRPAHGGSLVIRKYGVEAKCSKKICTTRRLKQNTKMVPLGD